MKLIVITALFVIGCTAPGISPATLQRLQVVFRHGYRAPDEFFWANDTCFNQSETGNLTDKGRRQMEILGLFLRARYDEFIGDSPDQMTVFSSDRRRCIQSAQLVANAAYIISNASAKPQVYVMTPEMDGPMALDQGYFEKYWPSSFPQVSHYTGLFQKVQSDVHVNSSIKLIYVADQILCEMAENCTIPDSLESNKDDLLKLDQAFYSSFRNCDSKDIVLNNTDVLRENILQVFNTSDIRNTEHNRTTLYCSHDDDMACLLSRMGVFDGKHVPFGAAIYFELHRIGTDDVVRVFYDNTTDHTLTQLQLPQCALDCPLQTFASLTETFRTCSNGSAAETSAASSGFGQSILHVVISQSLLFLVCVSSSSFNFFS